MSRAELLALLIELTVASSAAVVLVLLVRLLLRRWFGAGVAYAAWALVPTAILAALLPAPAVPLPVMTMVAPVANTLPAVAGAAPVGPVADYTWGLLLAWGLGVVATAAWFAILQWRFRRVLGAIRRRADGLHQAEAVAGLPAVLGLWRPRIVVPVDFEQRYDAQQRRLMHAHERVHIGRGDLHCNAAAVALRSLFWFNPLLHLAWGRYRHDQELACDQRVIARHPEGRRAYAEAMFKTQLAAQSLPIGCHWGFSHPLKERIEMLKQPSPSRSRLVAGSAVVVVLTLAAAVTAWAAQPRQATMQDQLIDVRVDMQLNGEPLASGRMIDRSGQQVSMHDEARSVQMDLVATAGADGRITLDAKVYRHGKLVAEPRLIVADAKPGVIELGTVVEGNAVANDVLRIEVDASTAAERVATPPKRPAAPSPAPSTAVTPPA